MANDEQQPAAQWVEHPTGLALIPAAAPAEINETEPAPMAIRWEDWLDLWLAALERLAWCHPEGLPNPYKVPAWFTRAARRRLIETIGQTHILPASYAATTGQPNQDLIWRPIDIANPRLLPDSSPPAIAIPNDSKAVIMSMFSYSSTGYQEYDKIKTVAPTKPEQTYLLRPHGRLECLNMGADMTPPPVPWLTNSSVDGSRPAYDDYAPPNAVRPCSDDLIRIVEPIDTLQLNAVAMAPILPDILELETRSAYKNNFGDGYTAQVLTGAEIYAAMDSVATTSTSQWPIKSGFIFSGRVNASVEMSTGYWYGGYQGEFQGVKIKDISNATNFGALNLQTTVIGSELSFFIKRISISTGPCRWQENGTDWDCSGFNNFAELIKSVIDFLLPGIDKETLPIALEAAGRSLNELDTDFDANPATGWADCSFDCGATNRLEVVEKNEKINGFSGIFSFPSLPTFSKAAAAFGFPDRHRKDLSLPGTCQSFYFDFSVEAEPILTVQYYPTYPKIKRKK